MSGRRALRLANQFDCGKEFAFCRGETQVFELPISLFDSRHFYRSELR
jgi:hypothetical protein